MQSHFHRNKLIFTLLVLMAGCSIVMPVKAAFYPNYSGNNRLVESKETNLPSGRRLISEIRRIQGGSKFKMPSIPRRILRALGKFFKQIGKLWSKLFKHPVKKQHFTGMRSLMNLLKTLIIPIAAVILIYIIIHFLLRYRKGVQPREKKARAPIYPWHQYIKNALALKEQDPRCALGELMRAVIRYWVVQGELPDDPSLTVREVEELLKKADLAKEILSAFKSFRSTYENVIYGNQPIYVHGWNDILNWVSLLVGEEVKG
ncbi:MAG TPA: hypothetical protein VHR47_04400 [Bacillota bacterium]|nr:hypothetical protein [Bacillota bacterium]